MESTKKCLRIFVHARILGLFMILFVVIYILVPALILAIILRRRKCSVTAKPLIQVVVLGEIGHSPRMQYHALSLVELGRFRVEMIGFAGSKPIPAILGHPDVTFSYIRRVSIPASWRVPFPIYACLRLVLESLQLLLRLLFVFPYRAELVLVQSPPAVPTIFAVCLARLMTGTKFIVDFHNITYMHLASKVKNNAAITLVRLYEKWLCRLAVSSFCVTKSMKAFLETEFCLSNVHTLYDHPGPQFKGRTTDKDRATLEKDLMEGTYGMKQPLSKYSHLIVSSTSWTPDENFDLLIDALPDISAGLKSVTTSTTSTTQPIAVLFITGKGECRDSFVKNFNALALPNIHLVTAWLPAKDYPTLLGCADVGISLHTSTSGLDLPMKVVDMLGAECAVVALNFPALKELLGDGQRGMIFDGTTKSGELASHVLSVLTNSKLKAQLQNSARSWRKKTFQNEWNEVVLPVIDKIVPKLSRQARRHMK